MPNPMRYFVMAYLLRLAKEHNALGEDNATAKSINTKPQTSAPPA